MLSILTSGNAFSAASSMNRLALPRRQALWRKCHSNWSKSAPKTSGAVPSARVQKQNSDMISPLPQ